jgi:hypothetical protein
MKKIHAIPIFAILVFVISFSIHEVYALPSITLTPTSGLVNSPVTVSGSNFLAEKGNTVFVFFDHQLKEGVSVESDGSFTIGFQIPFAATLGLHTISISDSASSPDDPFLLASAQFTVTSPAIPEFPFPFSLVIIFVAVTTVYLVIRQKMTTNFKPF